MCFYAKIKAENQFPNPDKVNLALQMDRTIGNCL